VKSRDFSAQFAAGREIVVVIHNIRSILNVGAILRTCECLGITRAFATGWTPSPDHGLPHVREKIAQELHKTALGAEGIVDFQYRDDVAELLTWLKNDGFRVVGLEQDDRAISLPDYQPSQKIAVLLGEEVHGLTPELRDRCNDLIEIPMRGQKESFNVSVAAGIVLYGLATSLPKRKCVNVIFPIKG